MKILYFIICPLNVLFSEENLELMEDHNVIDMIVDAINLHKKVSQDNRDEQDSRLKSWCQNGICCKMKIFRT